MGVSGDSLPYEIGTMCLLLHLVEQRGVRGIILNPLMILCVWRRGQVIMVFLIPADAASILAVHF